MRTRLPLSVVFAAILSLLIIWSGIAQESVPETPVPTDSSVRPTSSLSISLQELQEELTENRQNVLLWPDDPARFVGEHAAWEAWLGRERLSAYSARDELLVSIRAMATIIPDLTVEIDEPRSDLIAVSGNPAAVAAMLHRLQDHPLLSNVTEDLSGLREQARSIWTGRLKRSYDLVRPSPVPAINVRNNWVTNVVWGSGSPGATVVVTLTRNISQAVTAVATADSNGLWHAYLPWEILAGDRIEVKSGTAVAVVQVPRIGVATDRGEAVVTGQVQPAGPESESLEVIVGDAVQTATVDSEGAFTAAFPDKPLAPGTPGFVRYTGETGIRLYTPFSVPLVNIRRDTSYGQPYGDTHSAGLGAIVWGSASPGASLVVTLTRMGAVVVTRTTTADQVGDFSVSLDRLIEGGDVVEVWDGTSRSVVPVVLLNHHVGPAGRTIVGTAPAGITTTIPGAPHSLMLTIGGRSYPLTTTAAGTFYADLSSNPYLAGLLGTLRYTTPTGDRVFEPVFVGDPPFRGQPGDWRADVILGQPDFSTIGPNEVVDNKLFNPGGTFIDRSTTPNRVYVYDAGNSRVLGLSQLGTCVGGATPGAPCTANSDCPSSTCDIQETRAADLVIGQPDFNASACNGDSGYQIYPNTPMASAATLCGGREEQLSILEGGSGATMAADAQGNLYVPDFFNNRVLRYDDPFATDTIADAVWGQADLAGTSCNRGAGFYRHTDAGSLCLAPPPGIGDLRAGVAVDAQGNLWVADNENNRVLRFPFQSAAGLPAQEADLVLGQPGFSTFTSGAGLNQMHKPASVRVDTSGTVYVADSLNHRVLAFEPPLWNGMAATAAMTGVTPIGLELDPVEGLWVNDGGDYRRFVHYVDYQPRQATGWIDNGGGLGVDVDGNLTGAGWQMQEGLHISPPAYVIDAVFLRPDPEPMFNETGLHGFVCGIGLEVAAGQLIYADRDRLLFWNNPQELVSYQAADGYVGVPDSTTRYVWGPTFGRMRADDRGHLWVIYGGVGRQPVVRAYKLPLQSGAAPILNLTSPLPVLGGGLLAWGEALSIGGIEVQPGCDCLWLTDKDNHRAFRVRNVHTQPVVDVVLGQVSLEGNECNQGRGVEFPSADSLCSPGALAFDGSGNLYVADHNLEVEGNWRLLAFDADTIPLAPSAVILGIPASHVLGRNGSFTASGCVSRDLDPMCGPWEPAFDSKGRMVVGFNGYIGSRFPMVYQDPLSNPLPVAALADLHSMPLSARFDEFDNLYILDHNRSRILIYRGQQGSTYAVTGRIETAAGDGIPGVWVETAGYAASGISDLAGTYTLTGLVTGTYALVPGKEDYLFEPVSRTVTIPDDGTGQDFVGYHGPMVTAVSPTAGVNDVSTALVITGSHFEPVPEVRLGDVALSDVGWVQASTLTATIPVAWPPGVYSLTVTNPNGQSQVVPNAFTMTEPPTVTILTPSSGTTVSELATVTVDGVGERVEIFLDGVLHGSAHHLPASWTWSTRQIPDGFATLRAVAYGVTGRIAESPTRTVRVTNATAAAHWLLAGLPDLDVTDLAIAPGEPDILYAVTQDGQACKSVDGGMFWTSASSGLPRGTYLSSLAISPGNPQTVYAGSADGGVYKTTDGGELWQRVGLGAAVWDLAIAPTDAQTLYAAGNGVYRTANGGASWTQVLANTSARSLAIDPTDKRRVFVGGASLSAPWMLFLTTDGGVTWSTRAVFSYLPEISRMVLDPLNPQILYVGKVWEGSGLYKSTDGGDSWLKTSFAFGVESLALAPKDGNTLYAGAQWGGVYESRNGGTTWADKSGGLPAQAARTLAVDPRDPKVVYAGLQGGGLWKTVQGDRWLYLPFVVRNSR